MISILKKFLHCTTNFIESVVNFPAESIEFRSESNNDASGENVNPPVVDFCCYFRFNYISCRNAICTTFLPNPTISKD